MVGFGVFQVTDKEECKPSVISAGYQLNDTVAVYGKEGAVGDDVRGASKAGLCTNER